jgi:hypothetical protein
MSGGKGGETETKQEIDPQFKQRILKSFDRGDKLSQTKPLNYMGLVQAAPADVTKNYYNQTNDMANLLGLGMATGQPTDSLPEHEREMGGLKGYTSYRGVQQELQRQHREDPDAVRALNQLIPGLMDPSKAVQQADWYKNSKANTQPQRPGSSYADIANMYRNYRR